MVVARNKEKLAFLFPGQGAQYVGMGRYLYDNHATTRELFETADRVLGFSISSTILEGPEEKLKETEITQPALLLVSVATASYLKEQGVQPTVMAGHSLGEYSALVVAESVDVEDALKLVHLRGRYMQEAVPIGAGGMAAILGLEDEAVDKLCEKVRQETDLVVEAAAYNCPGQVVVAGAVEGVDHLMQLAKEAGAKVRKLNVSAPFHCSLLRSAADKLKLELDKIEFKDPKIPYYANVDANLTTSAEVIANKLVDQVVQPVRWTQTLMTMLVTRTQRFVEVGAGRVGIGHLKKVDRRRKERAAVFAITDKEADLKEALELFRLGARLTSNI